MSETTPANSVMSSAVKRFLVNRISELFGIGLLIVAGGLMAAFVSASENDPSLNVATNNEVTNLLGVQGALVADLFFKSFGLVAFLVPLALASWGFRFITHRGLRAWYWRMPLLLLSVALVSGFAKGAALFFQGDYRSLASDFIHQSTLGLVEMLVQGTGLSFPSWLSSQILATALLAVIGLSFYIWCAGLTKREWGILSFVFRLLFAPFRWLFRGRKKQVPLPEDAMPEDAMPADTMPSDQQDALVALAATGDAKADIKAQKKAEKLAKKAAAKEEKDRMRLAKKEEKQRLKEEKQAARAAKKSKTRAEPVLVAGAEPLPSAPVPSKKPKKAAAKKQATNQTTFDFESTSGFQLPSPNLLKPPTAASEGPGEAVLQENARLLEGVLADFGVNGEIKEVAYGPVVTRYGLNPAAGTKSQRVIALADDIARSMSALSVRVAVVPGQNVIGIEMPNDQRETVLLRDILDDQAWQANNMSLPICLGKDIAGAPVVTDLAKMPHLLVAGTTGSGKSVGINAMILSLLYRHTPETCRLIMIDPKMLELSVYDGIPHLLSPVVTDPSKAVISLKWTVREMENRYFNMSKLGVRNITGYNERLAKARESGEVLTRRVQTGFDAETGRPTFEEQALDLTPLPYIVVIIDEVADLMLVAGKDIEGAVQRLAQMARAAGIHVIMATQRPSVDVITGTIKANFPTRISFQVTSKIDSRTILGEQGAEQLLGRGDMLFMEGGGRVTRVHGPFMEDQEVEKVTNFLRTQGEPEYDDLVTAEADEGPSAGGVGDMPTGESLYDQAVALVVREQRASTSFVQRHLKIGYNRAATIIEEMEAAGVISKSNHAGKREVLIQNESS